MVTLRAGLDTGWHRTWWSGGQLGSNRYHQVSLWVWKVQAGNHNLVLSGMTSCLLCCVYWSVQNCCKYTLQC